MAAAVSSVMLNYLRLPDVGRMATEIEELIDKSEVTDRIITVVKNFQKMDPSKVTPDASFQKDLGLYSLDAVEIVMALEEEFGFEIPDNEADKINSIALVGLAIRGFICCCEQ